MKFFNNIKSFSELKSQYRTLAIQNHPDRGGDVATMQAINNEYDELYKVWYNRLPEASRPMDVTGEESRRSFYTYHGWAGKNYNANLRTKDIAELVRKYCKEQWSGWKFSVRIKLASMCAEISVTLKGGPIAHAVNDEYYEVQTSYHYGKERDERIVEEAEIVMKDVISYLNSFRYNDSDAMIDYFDTNFYIFETIEGNTKWQEIHRTARVTAKAEKPAQDTDEKLGEIEIVKYSDKAFALFGETKPYKEKIKEIGGRFNRGLKRGTETCAGWIVAAKGRTSNEILKLVLS